MIGSKLDKIANELENRGLSKLAAQIDLVANTVDKYAAHKGAHRMIESIASRNNLKATNWPDHVKREIFRNISSAFVGRDGDDPSLFKISDPNKMPPEAKSAYDGLLRFLDIDFSSSPKVIDFKTDLSDLSDISKGVIENRIKILNKPWLKTDIPRDSERHKKQKELIKEHGEYNKEPIILIKRKSGYELYEGNHRLIQRALAARESNQGTFKLNAYLGVPSKKIDVTKTLKDALLMDVKDLISGLKKAIKR